ncbi:hypothetical protein NB037_11950 [Rathayibacter sp. ZW T2_19]|uniref:Lipoprotein n=1 Tax=Rathayibacter rubneri TaxID=2950106 RepID=A0A9X2DXZ4_9MICO|nr:hypothetical protein [Rathayibacter rubneri]MCM6763130.1 hypothetical protein [Rathayibacter rubneri]
MGRKKIGIASLTAVLLLTGCTSSTPPGDGPSARPAGSTTAEAAGPSGSPASDASPLSADASPLSAFEQQLPLRGDFLSQQSATTGSVLIERRADGSTWAVLSGFSTGDASDLRLSLEEGALEQDGSGAWVDTAGYSFEIAPLDPDLPDQEIAIPGARTMPAIATLTVMDYGGPGYPSLGSVALTG